MEKLIRKMVRDFGFLIIIGLIVPHFIIIRPGTLLSCLISGYISIENIHILSTPGTTFRSKIYLMLLLTLIYIVYICIMRIADLQAIEIAKLLVHVYFLLGWVSLFWQKVDAIWKERK